MKLDKVASEVYLSDFFFSDSIGVMVLLGRMDRGIHRRTVFCQFGQHVSFLHSGAIKDGVKACGTAACVFTGSRRL